MRKTSAMPMNPITPTHDGRRHPGLAAWLVATTLGGALACGGGGGGPAVGSGGKAGGTGGAMAPPGSGGASASGGATASGGAPSAGSGGRATGGSGSGGSAGGSGGAVATGGSGSGGALGGGGTSATGGSGPGGGGGPVATFCPGGTYPAPALNGLTPTRIAAAPPRDAFNANGTNGLTILEGPVWAGDALYLSEIFYASASDPLQSTTPPASRILKVTAADQVTIALADTGSNGLALDASGALLAGDHKNGTVTRFALPGFAATTLVQGYMGMRFDSPNDLVLAPNGNLYFTDPDYQAPRPRPQAATRVYRLAPGATTPTVIDEMRMQPNGITLSPRGDTLYLNTQNGIYSYPVDANGAVGAGTRFASSVSSGDGLAIDCAGNLYIASGTAIVVVSPTTGMTLGQINVPGVQSVTNAAFGGADRKTLYITALGAGSAAGSGGGNPGGGGGFSSGTAGLFKVTLNLPGYPY